MHRPMPLRLEDVAPRLDRFVAVHYGESARVEGLRVMEAGHGGLTFGLRVVERSQGASLARLVLKLAPPGVRRAGNTDVYRQAPLLRALHAAGLPVPDVPFASPDEDAFGTPFVMMEFLDGHPFFVWDPDPAFDRRDEAVRPLWQQCLEALPAFHRFDWRTRLAGWEAPRPLREEVERLLPILRKSPQPHWVEAGLRVHERLLATLPEASPVALVHGDFQPGNVLYAGGRMTGIIDWELASIGSPLHDVGWLMMLADRESWVDTWHPVCPLAPEAIAEHYQAGMGTRHRDLAWYQALAGYRLGAISCLNLHLHRSGRRVDAAWERFALAIEPLFARAEALLGGA